MTRLANLLLAGTEGSLRDGLLDSVGDLYRISTRGTIEEALTDCRGGGIDLLVVDMTAEDIDGGDLMRLMTEDARGSAIPSVLIDDGSDPDLCTHALAMGAHDGLALPMPRAELVARFDPLLRLSIMHGELVARAALADRMSGRDLKATELAEDTSPFRLLFIGADPADAEETEAMLGNGGSVAHCDDLFKAIEMMGAERFDAAILNTDLDAGDDSYLSLCTQVRNNPRLFNLPMLLLADPGRFDDPEAAYKRGVSLILRRPVDLDALSCILSTFVRRQRLRWTVRGGLDRTRTAETLDAKGDAYSFDFLRQHLDGRIRAAKNRDRDLTLVFFSVANLSDIGAQFGGRGAGYAVDAVGQLDQQPDPGRRPLRPRRGPAFRRHPAGHAARRGPPGHAAHRRGPGLYRVQSR